MEYRRFANVLSNRYLGRDTKLVPQLEDYDLFKSGVFDPFPPTNPFKLVLNVASVSPKELELAFPEDNILQVTAKHPGRKIADEAFSFARDCTIKYLIPDDVNKNDLVARWHKDQFLVIFDQTVCGKAAGGSGSGREGTVSQSKTIPVVDLELGSAVHDGEGATASAKDGARRGSASKDGEGLGSGAKDGERLGSGGKDSESGAKEGKDSESGAKNGEDFESGAKGGARRGSATKDGEGFGSGAKDGEIFGSGAQNGEDSESGAKDGEDSESGAKDGEDSESGAKDGEDSESGANNENIQILIPVKVNQLYKPFIDVDELRDNFAEIADEASLDENYVLGYFFTNRNVSRQKTTRELDHPVLRAMLSSK